MPQGDRTGPMGQGSRTGRGIGFCSGSNVPGYMNPGFRRGFGFGRGQGRGFGRGFGWRCRAAPFAEPAWEQAYPAQQMYPEPTKEQEKQMLEQEAKEIEEEEKALKQEKESIKKRLEELD